MGEAKWTFHFFLGFVSLNVKSKRVLYTLILADFSTVWFPSISCGWDNQESIQNFPCRSGLDNSILGE